MSEEVDVNRLQIYVDNFFDSLTLYDDNDTTHNYKDLLKAAVDVFLKHESDYTAKEVYRMFFMIYQITHEDKSKKEDNFRYISEPNTLLHLVDVMEKYEKNTGVLIDRQRDHFIHSVNVFLLGLAIYAENKKYRSIFKKYVKKSNYNKYYQLNGDMSSEEFLYRWGVASLLHDIGYPFEIVGKQLSKIINDGVKSISNSYDLDVGIDFSDFNDFNSIVKIDPYDFADKFRIDNFESKVLDLYKPTEIMAFKISKDFGFNEEKFKLLLKHLNSFVDYMRANNFIDHGFYSAILVLNSYGKLMQKYAKNKDFFFYPIVDSATAILLHNYYNKTLQEDPFKLKQMSPSKNPIAYLLILCDELQEWNRQPFGLIDKKKLHVNDLNLEITQKKMDVEYILKYGYMGLGFSKDKKEFIDKVLDVNAIFKNGLSVSTDVEPAVRENIMRKMDIDDIEAPDVLIKNIEQLAIAINDYYVEKIEMEYDKLKSKGKKIPKSLQESYDYRSKFEDLQPEYKLSNLRQARSIAKKLNMIGCEIAPKPSEEDGRTITEFDENEVISLARFEHQEWCEEKRGNGWVKAKVKNNAKRETPHLVEWDKLSKKAKDLDINAIKSIPFVLDRIGLRVVRSKIRLLTYEMQKYYEMGYDKNEPLKNPDASSEERFNLLDGHVKYANYKQANFIVKILNERGYDLVPVSDIGTPVMEFDEHDLEHFAEREHYGWCVLKYELGWKYGSEFDENEMTSPNLVKWDDLDEEIQENNRKTFKHLPEMCAEESVGLKIVKSK